MKIILTFKDIDDMKTFTATYEPIVISSNSETGKVIVIPRTTFDDITTIKLDIDLIYGGSNMVDIQYR